MKKALAKITLFALSIVIIAGVIPLSASASTSNKSSKATVYSYLTNTLNLNSAAACGIMANIEKESNFKSTAVIIDSNGLPSGGLCMWNGKRFSSLKNFCNNSGLNYLSIEGQLKYLKKELSQNYYNHIYKYLKNVPNTSEGAYSAAHYWCYYFEVPANRSSKSVQRGNTAKNSYWKTYGTKNLSDFSISTPKDGLNFKEGNDLKVSWQKSSYADSYKLYLVQRDKKTGKFDYDNSKIFTTSSTSQTIKASYFKPGNSYKLYVYAVNGTTLQTKRSTNVITVNVRCSLHDYASKITKVPTEEKNGTILYTCKNCGKKLERDLTLASYFDSVSVQNFSVSSIGKTSVKLKWDELKYADGYRIYIKDGDKWVKVLDVKEQTSSAYVMGLSPKTNYVFKIKAFKTFEKEGTRFTVSSNVVKLTTKNLINR